MSKHKQYQYEEEEDVQVQGPNWPLLIVAYFAVLSVAVVLLRPYHLTMGGIFFAMVGAAIALALLIVLVKWAVRTFQSMNMSVKDVYHLAIGYNRNEALGEDEDEDDTEDQGQPAEPASIIERDPLKLSENFQPSFHAFLCVMALIVGMRRFGKSTLLLDLIEELARYGLPFVLFDTMNEFTGLVSRKFLLRPALAGNTERMPDLPDDALPFFEEVTPETAFQFGLDVMNKGLQAVINLKSYSDDDAALVMSEIVDGVNTWEENLRNAKRVPMMFFLDEAQKWFPQDASDASSDVHKDTQKVLEEAFIQTIVERGGKNGLGLVAATQRYSRINKDLLQGQWKFYLRQSEEVDLARYKKQGVDPEEALALQPGEVIVYGPGVTHFTFKARRSHAPHEGRTPDAQALTSYTQALSSGKMEPIAPNPRNPARKSSLTTNVLAESLDQERTTDVRMAPVVPAPKGRKAEEIDLALAIDLWNKGYNSESKLQEVFGITNHQAGKLRGMILERAGE